MDNEPDEPENGADEESTVPKPRLTSPQEAGGMGRRAGGGPAAPGTSSGAGGSIGLSSGGTGRPGGDYVGGVAAGGGIDWQTVTVTMALVPFVQAFASSFGAKLAGTIDTATRSAVRRFLRRQADEEAPQARTAIRRRIALLATPGGTKVVFSDDVPVEALVQVPAMSFSELEEPEGRPVVVSWLSNAWRAHTYTRRTVIESIWDPEAEQWVRLRLPRVNTDTTDFTAGEEDLIDAEDWVPPVVDR
jgi:hypothetical protein